MDTVTIVGITGAALVLFAFVMNQRGKWPNSSRKYDVVNMIGSFVLVYYAVETGSIPFVILNAVWFAVAFRDVLQTILIKRRSK